MFDGKTIAVVVPAFNEQSLIKLAIDQVPDYVDYTVVVDDASTDRTAKVLRSIESQKSLHCIYQKENSGVGGAIVAGYKKAVALGAEIVAVMAGDAQMDPNDLPGLLQPIVNGNADYSKGDRLSWRGVESVMPTTRFVGNHVLSAMTRITSGYSDIRDSQCGYTAISADALELLNLDELYGRYGFPNDILANLHTLGARVAQVIVRPIYGPETSGISLYTALVKVPMVLARSRKLRLEKESGLSDRAKAPLLQTVSLGKR